MKSLSINCIYLVDKFERVSTKILLGKKIRKNNLTSLQAK